MKSFLKNISPFNDRTEMAAPVFAVKKCLAYLLCYWAGLLIAEGIVLLIHFALGKNPLKGEMFGPDVSQLMAYYGYIVPIAVVLLYWRKVEKRELMEMGVNRRFGTWLIGGLTGIVLLGVSIGAIVLTGTVRVRGFNEEPDWLMIGLYLGGFAVQSAVEELLCRGYAFCSLKDRVGEPAAFGISTIFFVLPHLSSMEGMGMGLTAAAVLNLILVSAVFTLVMLIFDSIWAACGLHCLWNFVLMCVFGLDVSGGEAAVSSVIKAESAGRSIVCGGGYGIESSIVTTAVLAAGAGAMWFIYRRYKTEERS